MRWLKAPHANSLLNKRYDFIFDNPLSDEALIS